MNLDPGDMAVIPDRVFQLEINRRLGEARIGVYSWISRGSICTLCEHLRGIFNHRKDERAVEELISRPDQLIEVEIVPKRKDSDGLVLVIKEIENGEDK